MHVLLWLICFELREVRLLSAIMYKMISVSSATNIMISKQNDLIQQPYRFQKINLTGLRDIYKPIWSLHARSMLWRPHVLRIKSWAPETQQSLKRFLNPCLLLPILIIDISNYYAIMLLVRPRAVLRGSAWQEPSSCNSSRNGKDHLRKTALVIMHKIIILETVTNSRTDMLHGTRRFLTITLLRCGITIATAQKLLKLETPIKYNGQALPVCVPSSDLTACTECWEEGWGSLMATPGDPVTG